MKHTSVWYLIFFISTFSVVHTSEKTNLNLRTGHFKLDWLDNEWWHKLVNQNQVAAGSSIQNIEQARDWLVRLKHLMYIYSLNFNPISIEKEIQEWTPLQLILACWALNSMESFDSNITTSIVNIIVDRYARMLYTLLQESHQGTFEQICNVVNKVQILLPQPILIKVLEKYSQYLGYGPMLATLEFSQELHFINKSLARRFDAVSWSSDQTFMIGYEKCKAHTNIGFIDNNITLQLSWRPRFIKGCATVYDNGKKLRTFATVGEHIISLYREEDELIKQYYSINLHEHPHLNNIIINDIQWLSCRKDNQEINYLYILGHLKESRHGVVIQYNTSSHEIRSNFTTHMLENDSVLFIDHTHNYLYFYTKDGLASYTISNNTIVLLPVHHNNIVTYTAARHSTHFVLVDINCSIWVYTIAGNNPKLVSFIAGDEKQSILPESKVTVWGSAVNPCIVVAKKYENRQGYDLAFYDSTNNRPIISKFIKNAFVNILDTDEVGQNLIFSVPQGIAFLDYVQNYQLWNKCSLRKAFLFSVMYFQPKDMQKKLKEHFSCYF